MTEKKFIRKQKLYLLRQLIEIEINLGYDITFLIAKPLSFFDFEAIKILILKRRKEKAEMNGEIIKLNQTLKTTHNEHY